MAHSPGLTDSSVESENDSCLDVVWSVNDTCLAKYSEDQKYYKAKIVSFSGSGSGQKALVSFEDYTSDCNEEVSLQCLRKIKRKKICEKLPSVGPGGLFSPLCGDEEKKRLKLKFANLDDSDDDLMFVPKSKEVSHNKPKWRTTKKKLLKDSIQEKKSKESRKKSIVAIGGKVKSATHASSQLSEASSVKITSPANSVQSKASKFSETITDFSSDEEIPIANEKTPLSGFSEEDFEKPKFVKPSHIEKNEPFVLSSGDSHCEVPSTINRYLREYQRTGIRFLYEHYRAGAGGILADDMGLGKTVQVISFIAAVLGKTGTRTDLLQRRPGFLRRLSSNATTPPAPSRLHPFLIIGPASTLYNWIDEFERWGHFTVGRYHKNFKSATVADLRKGKLEIVVTTFETCRDNVDEINGFAWEAVVADEAHRIKGLKASVTRALKSLTCPVRFALTGTPLQNRLEEFWCIVDWARPGALGSIRHFQTEYVRRIETGQRASATKRELALARRAQEELRRRRDAVMLRRTKDLIASQLPQKHELVVYATPSELQLSLYEAILAQDDMSLILTQYEPCPCDSGRSRGKCCFEKTERGDAVKALTFSYMHLLLKVSNHVALLLPENLRSERSCSHAGLRICRAVLAQHPHFLSLSRAASFRTLSDPQYCGKMRLLAGMLSVFSKNKSKVLLFSLSVRLLDILEQYIISKGYEFRRLDGSTPELRRVELVREFNRDPGIFIFLASTKAGGVGLNLTGANVVVIFDPNWNPSHDLQAQDRAYRLGQHQTVRVFRLVSAGTIEENIYLRQLYKQQLDRVAVGDHNARRYFHGMPRSADNKGELFGLENMFRLRKSAVSLTEDILQRNSLVEEGLRGYRIEPYVPPPADKIEDKLNDDEHDEGSGESSHSDALESNSEVGSDDGEFLCISAKKKSNKNTSSKAAGSKPQKIGDDDDDGAKKDGRREKWKTSRKPQQQQQQQQQQHGERLQTSSSLPRRQPSFESVSDVFAACNVKHTHENQRIVGRSRAEDHMTRCALEAVFVLHENTQAPAADCAPFSDAEEGKEAVVAMTPSPRKPGAALTPPRQRTAAAVAACDDVRRRRVFVGATPRAMRRRLLAQMAARASTTTEDFASTVMRAGTNRRAQMLRDFYTDLDPSLSRLMDQFQPTEPERRTDEAAPPQKPRRGHTGSKGPQYGPHDECSDDDVGEVSEKRERRSTKEQQNEAGSDDDDVDDTEMTESYIMPGGLTCDSPKQVSPVKTPAAAAGCDPTLDDLVSEMFAASPRKKARTGVKQTVAAAAGVGSSLDRLVDEMLSIPTAGGSPRKTPRKATAAGRSAHTGPRSKVSNTHASTKEQNVESGRENKAVIEVNKSDRTVKFQSVESVSPKPAANALKLTCSSGDKATLKQEKESRKLSDSEDEFLDDLLFGGSAKKARKDVSRSDKNTSAGKRATSTMQSAAFGEEDWDIFSENWINKRDVKKTVTKDIDQMIEDDTLQYEQFIKCAKGKKK